MSAIETTFANLLLADSALVALMTGGVLTWEATGLNGITQDQTPGSFDSDGFLKPTLVIREDTTSESGGIHDRGARTSSFAVLIHIYLLQELGTDAIEPARARVHAVLDYLVIPNTGPLTVGRDAQMPRDQSLNGASQFRVDYGLMTIRSS